MSQQQVGTSFPSVFSWNFSVLPLFLLSDYLEDGRMLNKSQVANKTFVYSLEHIALDMTHCLKLKSGHQKSRVVPGSRVQLFANVPL